MARKVCQTMAGDSVCCMAAQRGLLGRPMTFTTRNGARRCGQCDVVPSMSRNPMKAGKPVFRFRFHSNAMCGIGPSGCAALGMGGTQGQVYGTMLPPAAIGGGGGLLGGGIVPFGR